MTLNDCRRNIDEINFEILKLLNERARWALEIGKLKKLKGIPNHDPLREEEILKEMQAKNQGPLGKEAVKRIFKLILEECRKLETDRYTNKAEG
ncbi:MAG: chorismate mutase [candidate division KSB1 bacterium]|nr:chorismate mutase [candidate division KSB1 bacterium]